MLHFAAEMAPIGKNFLWGSMGFYGEIAVFRPKNTTTLLLLLV